MTFKLNLFWKELVLFSLTLFIGIFSANNYIFFTEKKVIEPESYSWDSLIVLMAFFVIFMLIINKFKRLNGIMLRFFLLLVVFSGSQIVFGSVVSSPWDLVLGLMMAAAFSLIHNVLVHDLSIMLGIAGVSSLLGLTISPESAILLLVILSFYDIIAVYWTKHMVAMAKGMIESGAIFGFVVPFELKDVFYHKKSAHEQIGEKFMILGSGDIGLPIIMVSSVAVSSLTHALLIGLFSLIGLFVTHLLFVNQGARKPMAALPPIATATIIGYLLVVVL